MDIIHGPTIPQIAGDLIYQVTLASGMIITNPSAFGNGDYADIIPLAIVSEDGRILSNIKAVDNDWKRRQAEAIADLREGRSTVYDTGRDLLDAMDKAIAENEARNR